MGADPSSGELLTRLREGDRSAATELERKYRDRLWDLAKRQIGHKLKSRIDPDDILQTVFRTFFRRIEAGQYPLEESSALWHLLVRITLNRIRREAEFQHAGKRSIDAEIHDGDGLSLLEIAARGPSHEDAVVALDLLEFALAKFPARVREIVVLTMQGDCASEIAQQLQIARVTVQRALKRFESFLERHSHGDLEA